MLTKYGAAAHLTLPRGKLPPMRSASASGGIKDVPAPPAAKTEEKSDSYSETMSARMGAALTYRHEDGMNYNRIWDDLIVGSCLQTPADAEALAKQGVKTVFCLQEDSDMEYFKLDIAPVQQRCEELGIRHVRFRIRDFDPFDLRRQLPRAVAALANAHSAQAGTAYIHCTAGLGRAPAVALAYMYWLRGLDLNDAYNHLRSLRYCSPRIEAIRAATADLLLGLDAIPVTVSVLRRGTAQSIQVAGLDVGWHTKLDLQPDAGTRKMSITRQLMPGRYPFKFIVDDRWTYSADHPTYQDGHNINNYIEVVPRVADYDVSIKQNRLLAPTAYLTEEDRAKLRQLLSQL